MDGLFKFELEENNSLEDNTNINRLSVFVSDEQKKFINGNKSVVFKNNGVDNFSDWVIKKFYEEINFKEENT